MTRPHPIKRIRATEMFGELLRKLPPDIQEAARLNRPGFCGGSGL